MSTAAMKVLVVDDDDAGRYVKAHILAGRGYAVTEAGSGRAAIEEVAADPPDLVLLDVRLPDIGGVEVCRQIKTAFPQVAVLQTSSALSSAPERAAALDGGGDSYLIEPIEPDELVAVVKPAERDARGAGRRAGPRAGRGQPPVRGRAGQSAPGRALVRPRASPARRSWWSRTMRRCSASRSR